MRFQDVAVAEESGFSGDEVRDLEERREETVCLTHGLEALFVIAFLNGEDDEHADIAGKELWPVGCNEPADPTEVIVARGGTISFDAPRAGIDARLFTE